MLTTHSIKPTTGSRKKSKRLGRGNGSGKGTYSSRGMNGQNCRSGGGVPDWFEGGQTPLFRRMPKLKGFSNAMFKTEYNVVNLDAIEALASAGSTDITPEVLLEKGVITRKNLGVKILGNGSIKTAVTLTVDKASKAAIAAVEKAGGTVNLTSVENSEEK